MGFIENTYIDTVNNPESTSYEGLYGIGGVILGFGLTFIYDYYKMKKDNRKVGKSFESILVDTKEKCRFQISHIEVYQKEFETNKNAVLGRVFIYENNPLSNIDKYKLFDYYYSLRKDASKKAFFNTTGEVTEELIHKNINLAFNDIAILYLDVKSMDDVVNRLTTEVSAMINEYISLFNNFAIAIADYKNQVGGDFVNDQLAVHLDTLISKHSDGDFDDITSLKDSLHKDILLDTSFYKHQLYKIAFDFDSVGIQRLHSIEGHYNQIDDFLNSKKDSIKEMYKVLYKQDLITKAV